MKARASFSAVTSLLIIGACLAPAGAVGASTARSWRAPAAVCRHRAGLFATCKALALSADGVVPLATTSPAPGALGPAELAGAYQIPQTGTATWQWNGRTIAIVDAMDNPNAANDMTAFRYRYHLPRCLVSAGCFTKISQTGSTRKLPPGDKNWGMEIDLDIEMASAVCPNCKILLVEAKSASLADLIAAENEAAAKNPSAISNSWGSTAELGVLGSLFDSAFDHPGIPITAGTGDSGYAGSWPSDTPTVIAVGGTTLTRASNARGWTETAWSNGGSWCSDFEEQPPWQAGAVNATAAAQNAPVCVNRVVADVSIDADPQTGVAVYDSYGSTGSASWYVFGGTSVGAPVVASLYALAGDHIHDAANPYPGQATYNAWYANHNVLNDPVSGSNGDCGGDPAYMCNAGPGWDAPTGLGTPAGLAAF